MFFSIFLAKFLNYTKNVNFDKKRAVRGAISQKEGIEILQDAPHIEAFWNPDQVVSSAFMEMKVTLEEGCAWNQRAPNVEIDLTVPWDKKPFWE